MSPDLYSLLQITVHSVSSWRRADLDLNNAETIGANTQSPQAILDMERVLSSGRKYTVSLACHEVSSYADQHLDGSIKERIPRGGRETVQLVSLR